MVEKEKIIQDMLKILSDYCDLVSNDYCDIHDCYSCFAILLYNAGYRKVGDDKIVMDKEEWETLHNDYAKALYNARKNERKETVREILQLMQYYDIEHPVLSRNDVYTFIANKYGVELEF